MGADQPLVSLVVPVFNGMPFLPETVASLENQTYKHTEILLSDGGSTDESRQWLASIDNPQVRVILHDNRLNAAENWTQAVEAASGQLVKLVCQDDELTPLCVAEQVEALRDRPNAVMVASKRSIVNQFGETVVKHRGLAGLSGEVERAEVLRRVCRKGTNILGEPASVMFTATALKTELPWSQEWPYLIDLEMYLRVLQHGTLIALPKTLATFRVSDSSWSSRLVSEQSDQFCSWLSSVAGANGPDEVSKLQLMRGFAAARIMQRVRRVAYTYERVRHGHKV